VTIPYPQIPPDIIRIGPFALRWYGVMYLVGFVLGHWLAKRRIATGRAPFDRAALDSLIGYLVAGMLVGARLVYVVVYDPRHFRDDPLAILRVWEGGLSFHGAIIGMTVAIALFARAKHVQFLRVTDLVALVGTPGLFFGRLGNFINAELWGRATTVPWAMVFPTDPQRLPRHPSQLYEAIGEGVLLSLFLRALDRRSFAAGWYRPGLLTAAFLVGYGVVRFLIEFMREPDKQLGFIVGAFSMGQLLSAIMVAAGVVLWIDITRRLRLPT
jgi:phosphatidylglycerol---prolipoprotein diacylglyceryl transferase